MKIEIKLSGSDMMLVLEDVSHDSDVYEATLIMKRKQGGDIKLGRVSKSDLKRVAKAS